MRRTPRWLANIVAGLGILTNLPAMFRGVYLLFSWITVNISGDPYFNYSYLRAAIPWFLVSTIGVVAGAITISRRTSYDLYPILSLVLGLICLILLPNAGPRFGLTAATTKLLGHADRSLSEWDQIHGRFPSNEQELRGALAVRPLGELPIFYQKNNPISYDVCILTNATNPTFEQIPANPGTIIYAVSPDFKEYWLAISTLSTPTHGPVVLHNIGAAYESGRPFILTRKHHEQGDRYQPFFE